MNTFYKLFGISITFGMLFLFYTDSFANWIEHKKNTFNNEAQLTQPTEPDSLPEGITKDFLNHLKDENGKKIIPDEEGDAYQTKTFTGLNTGDQNGYSVNSAGDVNGDGYDDIIIGAPNNDAVAADAGRAYIFYGGLNMNTFADVTLSGEASGNLFGRSVSSAGDVNGDGYPDVIVGAHAYNGSQGRAYIYIMEDQI